MNRSVLYLRSSKDRSDVSIDAQRRALQELAAARSYIVVGEYVDAVESGKDDDRPGFQKLITDIRASAREWDHILVLDTSRIARRRAIGIIFEEHECKRRGVKIVYKSLPESDPITEMLLKSILQAMDEWHSLTSRLKGLSGMAENVRQGWRAGGRAPRGYDLDHVETGTVREGMPVTKTRLVVNGDARPLQGYLKSRAKGIARARAAQEAGLPEIAKTSLIDIDRNALTYAGHTVWNRHAERDGGSYVGGEKMRPRSEWVIQKNTHEPLITDAEAEAILAIAPKMRTGKAGSRVYILSGLLFWEGATWQGDGGSYRLGRGRRIAAAQVEQAIVRHVLESLSSDEMAEAVADHYRALANPKAMASESAALRREIADGEKRIAKLTMLLSDTTAPGALLRQIEAIDADRQSALAKLKLQEEESESVKMLRQITPKTVKNMLGLLADDMTNAPPAALKDALPSIVKRIELSPGTFEAVITYHVGPAEKAGSRWRPHGDSSLNPVFTMSRVTQIHHNRRARW